MVFPAISTAEIGFDKPKVIDNLYGHVHSCPSPSATGICGRTPEFFGGINLSDHASFWAHGFPAVMVTDTSFFRNRNYHQESDTIDTLNFEQMAEVVQGLYFTLLNY